jgi:two-component system cell cycle sensor histidine kinase/response regulator CckA
MNGAGEAVWSADARRLRDTLDAMREGLQIIGFDWRYVFVNRAVAEQGRKPAGELLGRTMMECYPGIDQTPLFALLERCMGERRAHDVENEFTHANGDRAWFELRIEPCPEGIAVLSVDVTERKRLEATMRQAQKMDAIGNLAGGVAHDFNNLLTVIRSYTDFARHALGPESPVDADLAEVTAATDRAAALTRQLLTFSRTRPHDPAVIDLNAAVSGASKLLARLLGATVELRTVLAPEAPPVRVDANAFEQVLMNLAVNARDAMPGGGTLTVETREVAFDQDHAERRGNVIPAGAYVLVAVTDSGTGMTAAVRDRLFEPFFTTKAEGRGTGLGLATSYGIVRQAGGFIWVYSEPGHGSVFKIYLPRAQEAVARVDVRPAGPPRTGTETVLVVEDDPQILALVLRCLGEAGYCTLGAPTAAEGEQHAARHAGPIHLLLSDVVLPRASGVELSERLLAVRPEMRVLFTSGFSEQGLAGRPATVARPRLLEKPFSPEGLLREVRAALDAA